MKTKIVHTLRNMINIENYNNPWITLIRNRKYINQALVWNANGEEDFVI